MLLLQILTAQHFQFCLLFVSITDARDGDNEVLIPDSVPGGFKYVFYNNTLVIAGGGSPIVYSAILSQIAYENTAVEFIPPLERSIEYGVCDDFVDRMVVFSMLSFDTQQALQFGSAVDSSLPILDAEVLRNSCLDLVSELHHSATERNKRSSSTC